MNSKPFSNQGQVKDNKPNVPKTGVQPLTPGFWAGSFNGGHNHFMGYKHVMANEYIEKMPYQIKLKLLTPKTPAYQPLLVTFKVFYVPNKRVMTEYEEFITRRGGSSVEKIEELPNFGAFTMPTVQNEANEVISICNTTAWRDTYVSSFLPRIGLFNKGEQFRYMAKSSALPIRGVKAIYNDFLRHKEYDAPLLEYLDNTVTEDEFNSYMPIWELEDGVNVYEENAKFMRARRPNSYYTDYRTELQGFDVSYPPEDMDSASALMNWTRYFENYIAEARSEAENYQLTPAEALAKLRGSKELKEGRVQLLSTHTMPLNYASITQSTYNQNNVSDVQFQVMGAQGAYSYTELKFNLIEDVMFLEDGVLHLVANVHAASVFESAYDRLDLNVRWNDQYRPDLKDEKTDVIYNIEYGTKLFGSVGSEALTEVKGFKRKYSEYYKIGNNIKNDLTGTPYYQTDYDEIENYGQTTKFTNDLQLTQNTYQFFEESDRFYYNNEDNDTPYIEKKPHLDYTDLLINKNQAYKNRIIWNADSTEPLVWIVGNNQIDYVAQVQCMSDMPIDADIKDNYTKWGEH